MYLIYDTETTNFPDKNLPHNHPEQAHIVQLAYIFLDEDFKERASFCSLFQLPDGVKISEGAKKAHGISEEECYKYGVQPKAALEVFSHYHQYVSHEICHNHKFDSKILSLAIQRTTLMYGIASIPFCTMEALTPLCRLSFKNGRSMYGQKYKWPSLTEAHQFCFGVPFDNAHDALADVRATARIFKWLVDNKHICLKPQISPTLTAPIISN